MADMLTLLTSLDTCVITSIFRKRWNHAGSITPAVDLFHLYRQHRPSLLAILLDAASHRAKLCGLPYPSEYENRVIRQILPNASSPDRGIVLATSVLATVSRLNAKQADSLHWTALQRMIELIGGLSALRFEPLLFTKMVWMLLALGGSTPGFDHAHHPEQASLHEEDALAENPVLLALCPGRPLGSLLRGFSPRNVLGDERGKETHHQLPGVQDSCRMAIILFLSSAAEHYGQDSDEARSYLASLQTHLEGRSDDSYLAPAHLLWAMLRLSFLNKAKEKCIENWISVVRMTSAWKGLDAAEREQLRADFLAGMTYSNAEHDNKPHTETASSTQPHRPDPAVRLAPEDIHCELMWFTMATEEV
ncbi:hypothetical protein PV08_05941 [Exophiala spinifera]|uniref:Uncharacterized protein n=1 Tax=Exophiala spinifera TaxID=91928 RepID=A0A0D1YLI3_9EURO|nr:uncharacterized protein PV08_05941 [Exophiala spinifera]KIW15891.1 hypothetical protein PV08_05941 [Exophiala spinifera]